MLAPFNDKGTENPYTIHSDLQECMQANVGIIRTESELKTAIEQIGLFKRRLANVRVEGNRQFNPGWHVALDLRSMLTVAEAVTLSALERKESRGGHTREDYPKTDPHFAKVNVVLGRMGDTFAVRQEALPEMPSELKQLFEEKA
jgi:succinate dehydrogenase / fumarate reductase flavoprotein subunit